MPHNFQRPGLPYDNEALQNDKRYQIITRTNERPPTDVMFDTDFNYLIDAVRQLDTDIAGVSAGILPGADDPDNANFLPTTDGAGNITWVDISDENIRDESISASKLIPQTITDNELMDASVVTDKIAPDAVTTNKILDFNVTTEKIADDAVTTDKIDDEAITTRKIAVGNVTTSKIADLNVTTSKIAVGNVTTVKLEDQAVTTAKIADGNVTTSKIADASITLPKMAANIIKIAASKADQIAGTSNNVYTNPAVQQNHPSAAKFWCIFNGTLAGTNAPIAGYNVTSVQRLSTGRYIINYIIPFSTTNYSIGGSVIEYASYFPIVCHNGLTTSNCSITVAISGSGPSAPFDCPVVSCHGFGLQ